MREITLYDTRKVEKRTIEEPPTEHTNRGARTGFIEDINTNLAQIRKIVNTPTLAVEYFEIGSLAKTTTAIVYLNDVASPDIVDEVRHRLKNLQVDDLLRLLGLFISVTLTPIYISLVTFHHELLPLDLLLSIVEQRREAPFPPIIEAFFMELIIEILREAGLRLPSPLGQTLGVVGGIVLGQAIVSAKIVGPLIIIVVSISAISSFIIPNYSASLSIRLAKYPLMLLAAMFGAFGISIGVILFITHQVSMQSFGVPYFAPLAPTRYQDLGDSIFLSHIWKMKKRPRPSRTGKTPDQVLVALQVPVLEPKATEKSFVVESSGQTIGDTRTERANRSYRNLSFTVIRSLLFGEDLARRDSEYLSETQQAAETYIVSQCQSIVEQLQNVYQTDALNLGAQARAVYGKSIEKIDENALFTNARINVNAHVKIRNYGAIR